VQKVRAAVRGGEQPEKPTIVACSQAKVLKEKGMEKDGQSAEAGFQPLPTHPAPELRVEQCGS